MFNKTDEFMTDKYGVHAEFQRWMTCFKWNESENVGDGQYIRML